jgi:hypothetical protein
MQDTLRIIIDLALMDGVFGENITTWKTLYSVKLLTECSETGRRLPISSRMRKVPVLRRTRHHRLTNDPVQSVDSHPQFRRLGRFCRFEHRLVAYCLRRGVTYVLAKETTSSTRRFLMGLLTKSLNHTSQLCHRSTFPQCSEVPNSDCLCASLASHPAEATALTRVPYWHLSKSKQHRSSEHICGRHGEGQTNRGQKSCSQRVKLRPPITASRSRKSFICR